MSKKTKNLIYIFILVIGNLIFYFEYMNLKYNFIGSLIFIFLILDVKLKNKFRVNSRINEEFGSARWGRYEDIKDFIDPVDSNNILFTNTERLTLNYNLDNIDLNRNNNVFVEGATGTGKTWFYIIPNILQMYGSYVVTDTKGKIITNTGNLLKKNGYDIKVFNLVNLSQSLKYNPFKYLKTELDILLFVKSLIKNTTGISKGDKFWEDSETLYLTALISFILEEYPTVAQNINTLLDLHTLNSAGDEDSVIDTLFSSLEVRKPKCLAVRQYKKFKQGAEKTLQSILISVSARLAVFDIEEIRNLFSEDELEFENIAKKKSIFFIITSDTERSLDFITSIVITQLINFLIKDCDINYNGEYKTPVVFLFDEFANCGKIPDIEDTVTVTRSRNIALSFMVQNRSKLKKNYKDTYGTIIANCDSYLFLGGTEPETLKAVSELLGKETINVNSTSKSYSTTKSETASNNKQGRYLLDPSEVSNMPNEKCIYKLRGVAPFYSTKYQIKNHKNYKYIDEKFDVVKYLEIKRAKNNGLVLNKKDFFIEIDLTSENLAI